MKREALLRAEAPEKQRLKEPDLAKEYDAEDASSDEGCSKARWPSIQTRVAKFSTCIIASVCLAALAALLKLSSLGIQEPPSYPPGFNYTEVILGYDQPALSAAWAELQESLAQALMDWFGKEGPVYHDDGPEPGMSLVVSPFENKTFRVLIASYVEDSEEAAERLQTNLAKLQETRSDDIFEVAMFLYDGSDKHFRERPWYADPNGVVVLRRMEKLCKAEALYLITPDLASNYSHIWLLDGGLSLDMFSWSIYHNVLAALEPLVSLPAMLPRTPEAVAPSPIGLEMYHWGSKVWSERSSATMPVTVDASMSDASCAVLASDLWPMIYNRLGLIDRRSDAYLSDAWDIAALASSFCVGPGRQQHTPKVTLVVASPVRVMSPTAGPGGGCSRGCGDENANCLRFDELEWNLTLQAINDSVRWADVDCFDTFQLRSVVRQCDMNFQLRGCRSWLDGRQWHKRVILYNGISVWLGNFKCLNRWPEGMADGECEPVTMFR